MCACVIFQTNHEYRAKNIWERDWAGECASSSHHLSREPLDIPDFKLYQKFNDSVFMGKKTQQTSFSACPICKVHLGFRRVKILKSDLRCRLGPTLPSPLSAPRSEFSSHLSWKTAVTLTGLLPSVCSSSLFCITCSNSGCWKSFQGSPDPVG